MYRPDYLIGRLVDGLGTERTVDVAEEVKAAPLTTAVEAPAARLVDAAIADAVRERASDVYFEPTEDGLVITSLVMNKETKEILSGPDVFSRGFIHEETKPEILYEAKCIVLESLDKMLENDYEIDRTALQEEIRRELKRFFNRVLDRRPVIYPIVVEI